MLNKGIQKWFVFCGHHQIKCQWLPLNHLYNCAVISLREVYFCSESILTRCYSQMIDEYSTYYICQEDITATLI